MLIRFYPESTRTEIDQFLDQMKDLTKNYSQDLSAAQLQGFFMHNKDSINDVFKNLQSIE